MDRLVIVPFDAMFTKNDADYDPFIKYKLRKDDVMEALIAKAIPALKTVLIDQEFEHCEKVDQHLAEFEKSNNPILEFFEDLNPSDYLNEPIKTVYQKYNSFCLSNNLQPISAIEFQKQIKSHYNLVIKTIDYQGKRMRVYCEE